MNSKTAAQNQRGVNTSKSAAQSHRDAYTSKSAAQSDRDVIIQEDPAIIPPRNGYSTDPGRFADLVDPARFALHFELIYGEELVDHCMEHLQGLVRAYRFEEHPPVAVEELWTHRDTILITYADMVRADHGEPTPPLKKQHRFLSQELKGLASSLHILPFFPSSSDDGFSVIDYRKVDPAYGNWNDIVDLAADFRLMGDLVLNHVSRESEWFKGYLRGDRPYDRYFIEVDPDIDLSGVTRPRSTPMLTPVSTANGQKLVWTTFSEDQKDVNFRNPDVLFEFLDILFFYVVRGIKVIRLDAVAFIWKEIGTTCIHMPQTHEIVKLMRSLVDIFMPDVTLITETNVPHRENISYFGDGDEAHMVYQFSLPPLLLHALLKEDSRFLTRWAESLRPPPPGCTFFNFTSSHDGIGVRPLEGLVPEEEILELVEMIKNRGGFVSYRQNPDGSMSPYELNITYFDAFSTGNGHARLQEKRFLCSQMIMLSLQGVPGIYFHNLTGTPNNLEGVRRTGRYRTINRKKWKYSELMKELDREGSKTGTIFRAYKRLLKIRREHPAFHPFGGQTIYDGGSRLFLIGRQAPDGSERVFVLCNMTKEPQQVDLIRLGLPLSRKDVCCDLISGKVAVTEGCVRLEPFEVLWVLDPG